ncbi:MAG: immunoglobulin domain-containing protein [Bacteroidota bacterium]
MFSQNQGDWIWYEPDEIDAIVRGLNIAPDGALWLSSGEQIVRFDGNTWEKHEPADDGIVIDDYFIRDLAISPSGNTLWSSATGFVMKYDLTANEWTVYDTLYEYTDPNAFGIVAETDEKVYWAMNNRLYEFNDPVWAYDSFYFPNDNISNGIRGLLIDSNDDLWITMSSSICIHGGCFTPGGILRITDTDTTIYDGETLGFPTSSTMAITLNNENNILAATSNHFASGEPLESHYMTFENGTWQPPVLIPFPMHAGFIRQSTDGTIWVSGREDGTNLAMISYQNPDGSWGSYTFEEARIKYIETITLDEEGNVWIGGRDADSKGALGFLPNTNFTASGSIYQDENANGIYDASEQGLSNVFLEITPGPQYILANNNGEYTASLPDEGTFWAKVINPLYASPTIPVGGIQNIDVTLTDPIADDIDFGILPDYSVTDVAVNLTSIGGANPGFETCYRLSYKNIAPLTASGQINCIFDDILIFQNASVNPTSISGNNLTFDFSNLNWRETAYIDICFLVPPDVYLLGKIMQQEVNIVAAGNDANLSDNQYILNQEITGAYDPNFIEVNPKGDGIYGIISTDTEILEYTIHFQNTGTDTAHFVIVTDFISDNFEIISFDMIAASHDYEVELIDNNIFKWTFNEIYLPDSISNEKESHGFIKYKIEIKNNLTNGTKLTNKADIYFDFNPPIKTNQTLNTLSHFSIKYVAEGATGTGTSWADASGDLQAAINEAVSGEEIWVKEGSYYPTSCSACEFADKDVSFNLAEGVKIYGGFAGTESSVDERNISEHPTYLSGDIDRDGTLENNSYTVVYADNVDYLTVLNGFIITGGNAHDANYPTGSRQNSGGAFFINGATNESDFGPFIQKCRFENNYAWGFGGAVFNDAGFTGYVNAVFIDCSFNNNSSRSGGGAVYNNGVFDGYCVPTFYKCFFENNNCTDLDGGAIFNTGSENGACYPKFEKCEFKNNIAGHDGGAVYSFGKNGNSTPHFLSCIFENNQADQGGALYNDGTFDGSSLAKIEACIFKNNLSTLGDGGAIYDSGFLGTCRSAITYTLFEKNQSTLAGGAIFNNGVEGVCSPDIYNCRFIENEAVSFGGAIYNQGRLGNASPTINNCVFAENKALSAGAIYNLGSGQGNANPLITNCTFYKNNANVGGAVYANAGEDTSGISSPTIANCIFWKNTANDIGDIFRIINGTPTISYSLVDKNDCADLYNGNGGFLDCLDGMVFNEDPLFVDTADHDFHLVDGSPAIDVGSNAAADDAGILYDLDYMPRIYNGTVDLGAFEHGSTHDGSPIIVEQPEGQALCEGSSISLSVEVVGVPPFDYQWYRGPDLISGVNGNTLTIDSVSQQDEGYYRCLISNDDGGAFSHAAYLEVQSPEPVSLTISVSKDTICEGEEITLTAQPVNGGDDPVYQWFINGNAFGGNIESFNIDALNDGDEFSCEITSSATCITNQTAVSNTVTIHVENNVMAALIVAPDEEVPCEGQTVTFTATPENGGSSPSYQWSVNGNLAGDDSSVFQYVPQQNDEVYCSMISSKTCVEMAVVSSDTLRMEVVPNKTPTIGITPSVDSTICVGDTISFASEFEHGGNPPVFDWLVNGASIGENGMGFTTSGLSDGDVVVCRFTSSLTCLTENPVLSNEVTVSVDSCVVNDQEQFERPSAIVLYPNPTDGRIFVEISNISGNFTTCLLNTHGQTLMSNYEDHPIGSLVKQEINLADLPQGIYYFQIITDGTITTKRIVVY